MDSNAVLEEARQVFVEESRELVREMESALLRLEADPGDREAINALFRAAHTLKGSAGLFDFAAIVRFTHVVESVLDRLRNGEIDLDGQLMPTLLGACDHVATLVESACVGDGIVSADTMQTGQMLRERLEHYLCSDVSRPIASATESRDTATERAPGGVPADDAWHISVRFGRDILKSGMDPLAFLRYLATMGEIVGIATLDDDMPAPDEFDPEACYLGFELQLRSSSADKKSIEDAFEFVRGDCVLHILPPESRLPEYLRLMASLPESRERLGEILVECGALTAFELQEALAMQRAVEAPPKLGEMLVEAQRVPQAVVDAALDKQQRSVNARAEESRFVRVAADKLDHLITLVGELVIAGAGANLLARSSGNLPLQECAATIAGLTEEIREGALRLRMVQIGETFNRFRRIVRDLGQSLGKDIALEIGGAETELDKTVVEKIADPLTHLVRNAMDHGIEAAEVRVAAGKPARGRIRLNAFHDAGSIVIEVGDDGKGLDRERILAKARERGLLAADEMPADAEIFKLIFEPGFSTAETVSDLSGRGVGMDVVRQNIEALRGTVSLTSEPGQGTTVSVRLPLTLAIIDGFLVQVGEAAFVVPLDAVVECVELPAQRPGSGQYLALRGQVLPYLRLKEVFDLRSSPTGRESVVVVQCCGTRMGIVVDRLLGELQAVIKPLGRIFASVQGISGSTILGTGEVALILDVPSLVQLAERQGDDVAACARAVPGAAD